MITKINLSDYNVELHLIRHGQDESQFLGGWSDNHLTDYGTKEVLDLVDVIDNDYDLFVSSDLNRAVETSKILNNKLKMNVTYNPGFRETNNGDLKNLTIEEAKRRYPGLYFSSLKMDQSYPHGESPLLFFERIKKAFIELMEQNRNKKILLVTHGGVITVILCLLDGLEYTNQLRITPATATLIIAK